MIADLIALGMGLAGLVFAFWAMRAVYRIGNRGQGNLKPYCQACIEPRYHKRHNHGL